MDKWKLRKQQKCQSRLKKKTKKNTWNHAVKTFGPNKQGQIGRLRTSDKAVRKDAALYQPGAKEEESIRDTKVMNADFAQEGLGK